MKKISLLFLLGVLWTGMGIAQKTKTVSAPKISNGIKLFPSKGIKLVKAYLYYNDNTKLSDSNLADLNQNINMLIQIERGGWLEKNGKVSIGASEKITTNTGSVILNEPDLFSKLTDIDPDDARYITLKAVITSVTKKISFFLVNFTVWDKWSSAKITGSYRFKLRP